MRGDIQGGVDEQRVRFVLSADWQLGMVRHFLDPDAQARYTAARLDAVSAIGELAAAQDAEFVLVCGDVFETNTQSARSLGRAAERLAAFDVPVLLLPGNHDPLDAASIYRHPEFRRVMPPHVRVLDRAGRHPIRPGVEVVAAPWFGKHPGRDLVAAAVTDLPADGTLRIVAGHGMADRLSADPTDPTRIDTAGLERVLGTGAVHLVALGDRHSTTSVGSSGRIWYPGTPVVTDYDEVEPGQALLVELDPTGVQVGRHRVGGWVFEDVVATLSGGADVDALLTTLAARPAKDSTVLRLSLTGTLTLAENARWETGLTRLRETFAAIELWDKKSDLAVLVDPDELADLGVRGYAEAAVGQLQAAAAGDPADVATVAARDALGLLYRLVTGAAAGTR